VLARAWLARVGFGLLVDAIVGGEDVTRGKPDPAPYIEAMGRLDVEPRDCIAVEDSKTGAAAALAAGARTYMIEPSRFFAPRGMHRVRNLQDLMPVIR
jgi:beta-phosphoglucomutase-like phosphatase (HAD superfamily)